MLTRLQRYLQSHGQRLPKDLADYKSNGKHAGKCLFCEEALNEGIIVFYYPLLSSAEGAVNSGAPCCANCAVPIYAMETGMGGRSARIGAAFYEMSSTEVRRVDYIKYAAFDSGVSLHYAHGDRALCVYKDYCYFCKQKVTSPGKLIQVPVDSHLASRIFTGGQVLCCVDCEIAIMSEYDVSGPLVDSTVMRHCEERCVDCEESYYVTATEAEIRSSQRTTGKHLCPKCAYNQLLDYPSSEFFSLGQETGLRIVVRNCAACGTDVLLDFTLPFITLMSMHKGAHSPSNAYCTMCNKYGGPLHTTKLPGGSFINFYQIDSKQEFLMLEIYNSARRRIGQFSRSGNVFDIALEFTLKELEVRNSEQTRLDL